LALKSKIGIIGVGKMGEALVSGLTKSGLIGKMGVMTSDALPSRREYISKTYHVVCDQDVKKMTEECNILIVAVQPRDAKTVLEEIKEKISIDHLLISIAAGVPIAFFLKTLKKDIPIIRAMPNNPCMIGEGMITLAPNANVSDNQLQAAKDIFSSVGRVIVTDEKYFDAITGLSGSGPAYIYLVIEALADGGVKAGIPKDLATELVAQTVLGSAKMVLKTGEPPAKLRDLVTTPGGTTISGIMELEEGKVRATFMRAVEKAAQRARELAQE